MLAMHCHPLFGDLASEDEDGPAEDMMEPGSQFECSVSSTAVKVDRGGKHRDLNKYRGDNQRHDQMHGHKSSFKLFQQCYQYTKNT